jgi:hypothetical protein
MNYVLKRKNKNVDLIGSSVINLHLNIFRIGILFFKLSYYMYSFKIKKDDKVNNISTQIK